ncbi:uncharacterized protein N7482_009769 [Penicillium canariense]|uniref:Uncharacterized protein n=1 Tax=Penicillium canariense TaxID=189055 RepID=A0A9W9LF97_9EURO|nr:uncharacterized protein N7482_009769 [Penicillium canariense]KAJ5153291.1 hypothetical protein N7482_009769 [Penicillium canariense]
MKTFAISAAILASTVAALPTRIIPGGASGVLPSGIPSCLPSGVLPAGVTIPSGIPTCIPSASAIPSVGTSKMTSQATSQVHSVLTVTDQASKSVLVELEPTVASLLSGLNLGSVTESVGQIIQVAPTVGDLNLNGATGGLLTVATGEGSVALVKLTSTVEGLLSGLGLPEVGSLVGSLVGTIEGAVSGNLKRDPLSDVMSITDLNGNNLLVQVEPTVLGLLGGLNLASIQGTVGTVVAQVPAVSGLAAAAQNVAADPTQLFGVLGEDGTSALLVKVEGTATGLLATLGLQGLTTTVGSVVPVTSL